MSDGRGTVPFNAGWVFGAFTDGCERPGFDDGAFAPVTLPHTVAPLSWQDWDPASWERAWAYRKRFDAPPGQDGQRVQAGQRHRDGEPEHPPVAGALLAEGQYDSLHPRARIFRT